MLVALSCTMLPVAAQEAPAPGSGPATVVTVRDENGLAVPGAAVTLVNPATGAAFRGSSDIGGRLVVPALPAGTYRLEVRKTGFYELRATQALGGGAREVEIVIHHHQETGEVVNVTDVPPAIDPQQTVRSERLNSRDIINIPYPTTRDIRNLLPFIPGVLRDNSGLLHAAGSRAAETEYVLDGFNFSEPTSGTLEMRVSPDALRQIEVQNSRYSTQYDKGAALMLLETRSGDDQLRFSAVNFIPTLQSAKGIQFNNWTPRVTFSGPLRRGRAWFYLAADGEVDRTVVEELPDGADSNVFQRAGVLAKAQFEIRPGHVLSASFLPNGSHADHAGLSVFRPVANTVDQRQSGWFATLKDQITVGRWALVEIGMALHEFRNHEFPLGSSTDVVRPDVRLGNFYRTLLANGRRQQGIANLYLRPRRWHGSHELRLGVDVDRAVSGQSAHRNMLIVQGGDGTAARRVEFTPDVRFQMADITTAGYVQDRWSATERLLIEAGTRFESDRFARGGTFSPRVAGTYLLADGETKLTGGIGLFRHATDLDVLTRPLAGERTDSFFAADGATLTAPPVVTRFVAGRLPAPQSLNWSVGVERRLPGAVFGRVEFVQRRGDQQWAYAPTGGQGRGTLQLESRRRDRYDAVQVAARRDFRGGHAAFASYTFSRARSNQVIDFTVDDLLFAPQSAGRLAWDAPHRLLSWGWLPFVWGMDLAYSLDVRTGFRFSAVDAAQRLAGSPNSYRFPTFVSLNPAVEKKFRLRGYQWAVRLGMDNITGSRNPIDVNNNIDSPLFRQFSGGKHRTFNGRIRFLGR